MFTRHLSVSSMFDLLPLSCFDFDQLMVLKTGVCVCVVVVVVVRGSSSVQQAQSYRQKQKGRSASLFLARVAGHREFPRRVPGPIATVSLDS